MEDDVNLMQFITIGMSTELKVMQVSLIMFGLNIKALVRVKWVKFW